MEGTRRVGEDKGERGGETLGHEEVRRIDDGWLIIDDGMIVRFLCTGSRIWQAI